MTNLRKLIEDAVAEYWDNEKLSVETSIKLKVGLADIYLICAGKDIYSVDITQIFFSSGRTLLAVEALPSEGDRTTTYIPMEIIGSVDPVLALRIRTAERRTAMLKNELRKAEDKVNMFQVMVKASEEEVVELRRIEGAQ